MNSYSDDLFYVSVNAHNPPEGARGFDITTFPDAIAIDVINAIHRDVRPPRISPAVQARIDAAAIGQARLACGMNIDPLNATGNPSPDQLPNTKWVRLVFNARLYQQTLQDAFNFFDPIVDAFNNNGSNVLFVINHETYGNGTPFNLNNMNSAQWVAYTNLFTPIFEQITQHYGNTVAAYEIWNEGDVPNNPASVYFPPADFAPFLSRMSNLVRQNAPNSKVILGGLVGGSGISSAYVRDVKLALGGNLPVDGIGLHPYGLGSPDDNTVFSQFGSVQVAIDALNQQAPNMPIWMTEVGAIGSRDQQFWQPAAEYMANIFNYFREQPHVVPVAIWYAWSDGMDAPGGTNGIVTTDQQPKQPLFDTFFNVACQ